MSASSSHARKVGPPFENRATYRVFLKRVPGGGKTVILVEREPEGAGGDAIYEHSSATRVKTVYAYEITSKSAMTSYPVNRAQMGLWGYVGSISGYGANAYFKEGGDLRACVRDFGELAKRPGFFARLFGRFRKNR